MEVAFRAAATARPPPLSTLSCAPRASFLSKPTSRAHIRPTSLSLPTSTSISLLALFTAPQNSMAFNFPKEQIVSSLTEVENTINQVQEVGSGVLDFLQRVLQVVIGALKPTADLALPILQKAGDQALKIASPAISEASKKTQEALQSSGIDTEPVLSVAKTVADVAQQTTKVIEDAKPIASSTIETISSADPIVIAETAGALVLAYLFFPPIWSVISFSFRGYKGKLTPAQTLDLVSTQNHLLIDIRSEKDKNKAGIPLLPSSTKKRMISVPYCDKAKIVASALTSLGFKNCWVMADGFSGNKGWLQSPLGTDSYNVSSAEVLSPSQVIPSVVGRLGTTSSMTFQSNQKFLPKSSD
ncbi:hypothetical protein HHK36_029836 [Tetracentron sinense]|uniref:Rhodanese domain-containing protein n=1 Tax=Tetracentron sinense TaxID=13715 RepID=A0A834YCE0_TETSI|nr:hypothetical protein HHK36_029836 [Tetracentron sinense]